jgi:hypothetical protein
MKSCRAPVRFCGGFFLFLLKASASNGKIGLFLRCKRASFAEVIVFVARCRYDFERIKRLSFFISGFRRKGDLHVG